MCVGDLAYLISDKDKLRARNRYLVTSVDGQWCVVKKFAGNQLRANSYKIKCDECYLVPNECASFSSRRPYEAHESGDEDEVISAPEPTSIPPILTKRFVNTPIIDPQANTTEVPILLGLPEPLPEPGVTTSQLQANIDVGQPTQSDTMIPNTSRPRRESRRSKYLDDYFT